MKKILPWIIFVLLLLAGLAFGYHLSKQNNTTPSEILLEAKKALNVTSELQDYDYSDWKLETGELIPLRGNALWIGSANLSDSSLSAKLADLNEINEKFLEPYMATVDEFFTSNGFSKEPLNSMTFNEGKDFPIYYRTGYERGGLMCIGNFYIMTDPFMNIVCGRQDLEQAELQNQVSGVFKYEMEPNKQATYRVDKLEDDWARGTYNEYVEGFTWFAHKKDGKWEIVWKSQEIGLCSKMKELGIPPSLYESCYVENGKQLEEGVITFPKKGTNLIKGTEYKLTWTPTSGKTNIFLVNKAAESQGVSVSLFDRVYNIPNTGEYTYKVPDDIPDGEYKFEIGDLVSDYFNISN